MVEDIALNAPIRFMDLLQNKTLNEQMAIIKARAGTKGAAYYCSNHYPLATCLLVAIFIK